jgi:uncharacterized protein
MKSLKRALTWSFCITLACGIWRVTLLPLYESGKIQGALAYFNVVFGLVMAPARFISFRFVTPIGHHESAEGIAVSLLIMFILCFVFAFTTFATAWATGRALPVLSSKTETPSDTAVDLLQSGSPMSRRQFLVRTARVSTAGAVGVTGLYSVAWEPRRIKIERHSLALADLPPELTDLRIVQLSDLHHGPWFSIEQIQHTVNLTNSLHPDIILLTGDYVSHSALYIKPSIEVLNGLQPRIGAFAVLGNHDWWEGVGKMRDAFARSHIRLIDNDRRILNAERRLVTEASSGLCIAGVGDLWEDEILPLAALRSIPDTMPRLMLAHNPDTSEKGIIATGQLRIDLMLSGHTHGGQVNLPLVGTPLVPSEYGSKYTRGFVDGPGCRVYCNRGVGLTGLPVRFRVPPEITLFELSRA